MSYSFVPLQELSVRRGVPPDWRAMQRGRRRPWSKAGSPSGLCLAGRGVGGSQLGVGDGPDTFDAVASADEQRRGSQRHEGQKQRILDQVLALLVSQKVVDERFHFRFAPKFWFL